MIVQRRAGGARIFEQHDHGLLCGELARAWGEPGAISLGLGLACALHDLPWRAADAAPRLNSDTGLPFDFIDFPRRERVALYKKGLDALEGISPHLGVLTSRHYVALMGRTAPVGFVAAERARQARLLSEIGGVDEGILEAELSALRFMDTLSLFVCMTPPGASAEGRPAWLDPSIFACWPKGRRWSLVWEGPDRLIVDPFPFLEPLMALVPFRDLGEARYESAESLRTAWDRAPRGRWSVTLAPAS